MTIRVRVADADDYPRAIRPVQFAAVGDGSADDTTPLTNMFASLQDGDYVHIDDGKEYLVNAQMIINVPNVKLRGHGKIIFNSGIINNSALRIQADGCSIGEVHLVNPNMLSSQSGGKNIGIEFVASEGEVIGTTVELFQTGIAIRATGEFFNFRIIGNRVKDCLGAGDGPSNITSSLGEDRGDGIVVWGAQATIVGNVVNCLPGQDARVGIHVEGLKTSEINPAPHSDALYAITSNVIYGQFRRGVDVEASLTGLTVANNVIADSTWWAIVVVNSDAAVVQGNAIIWTRDATQLQGDHWAPVRGPIMLYGGCVGNIVDHNSIIVVGSTPGPAGACTAFLLVNGSSGSGGNSVDCLFDGNVCIALPGAAVARGFFSNAGSTRVRLRGNSLQGFTARGMYLFGADDFDISNNYLDGLGATTITEAILFASTSAGGQVKDNRIKNMPNAVGISLPSISGPLVVDNNILDTLLTGIDLTGGVGVGSVRGNLYNAVTTLTNNIPATYKVDPNSVATIVARTTDFPCSLSSTTPQSDSVLQVTLRANSIYVLDGIIHYDSDATIDLNFAWGGTAIANFQAGSYWSSRGPGLTVAADTGQVRYRRLAFTGQDAIGGEGVNNIITASPGGVIITGTNGGTLIAQFSQSVTSASLQTTIRAGSWLRVTRLNPA